MSSAAAKKRLDDKYEKVLRSEAKKPENSECFDCTQKGPFSIVLQLGTFVCHQCAGIHRGNPFNHRIKSISTSSFRPEEVQKILEYGGNKRATKVWLGRMERAIAKPSPGDEARIRAFMELKYIKKRYFVDPKVALADDVPKQEPLPSPMMTRNKDSPRGRPQTTAKATADLFGGGSSSRQGGGAPAPQSAAATSFFDQPSAAAPAFQASFDEAPAFQASFDNSTSFFNAEPAAAAAFTAPAPAPAPAPAAEQKKGAVLDLFSGMQATSQPVQPAQSGGGLLDATFSAPAPAAQAGGGLLDLMAPVQPQQMSQPASGGFGLPAQQQAPSGNGGLLDLVAPVAQPQPQSQAFGGPAQSSPAVGLFGMQAQQPQQQTSSGMGMGMGMGIQQQPQQQHQHQQPQQHMPNQQPTPEQLNQWQQQFVQQLQAMTNIQQQQSLSNQYKNMNQAQRSQFLKQRFGQAAAPQVPQFESFGSFGQQQQQQPMQQQQQQQQFGMQTARMQAQGMGMMGPGMQGQNMMGQGMGMMGQGMGMPGQNIGMQPQQQQQQQQPPQAGGQHPSHGKYANSNVFADLDILSK